MAKQYTLALPPGALLNGRYYRYRIERVLGQGAFGITYMASVQMTGSLGALDTNVIVAIKEFFMGINEREGLIVSGGRSEMLSRYRHKFIEEAAKLGQLNHPNIVKVLESFEANNTAYYVMDFIDGGSLNEYIARRGRLSDGETVRLTRQIGEAVQFMHDHRMLHLDLKPSNIMLRRSGEVVLIDFGLAKQFSQNGLPETSTSIGLGTVGYAPSEQACYKPDSSKGLPVTMDIYALGATMFKMLTGTTPPDASSILNYGFPHDEMTALGVDANLVQCVEKAMAPQIKDRYQSIRLFLSSLQHDATSTLQKWEGYKEPLTPFIVENSTDTDPSLKPLSVLRPESIVKQNAAPALTHTRTGKGFIYWLLGDKEDGITGRTLLRWLQIAAIIWLLATAIWCLLMEDKSIKATLLKGAPFALSVLLGNSLILRGKQSGLWLMLGLFSVSLFVFFYNFWITNCISFLNILLLSVIAFSLMLVRSSAWKRMRPTYKAVKYLGLCTFCFTIAFWRFCPYAIGYFMGFCEDRYYWGLRAIYTVFSADSLKAWALNGLAHEFVTGHYTDVDSVSADRLFLKCIDAQKRVVGRGHHSVWDEEDLISYELYYTDFLIGAHREDDALAILTGVENQALLQKSLNEYTLHSRTKEYMQSKGLLHEVKPITAEDVEVATEWTEPEHPTDNYSVNNSNINEQ